MSNKPLVSVCVVTYQHVNYIKQCLDSILMQQTSFPFEIILGEDESTDGTREICKDYAARHPNKIRLFLRNRKDVIAINGNPTGRYNFIENMKSCSGKYIALCDGDDYWTDPLKLQKQVDFLESNPNYVISSHNVKVVNSNGDLINNFHLNKDRTKDFTGVELMTGRHLVTLSMCFRNVIKVFPKDFYKAPNGDSFLVALLGEFGDAKFQSEINNGVYRLHSGGIWSSEDELSKSRNQIDTYFYMYNYFKHKSNVLVRDKLFDKYFNKTMTVIGMLINKKDYSSVLKVYLRVSINCLINGSFRKTLRVTRFVISNSYKN